MKFRILWLDAAFVCLIALEIINLVHNARMPPLSRLSGCLLILLLTLPSSAEAGTKRNPATVREFKRTHICPSTGTYTQKCPGYVVDHLQSLCSGGRDSVENMAYQEYNESLVKDKLEWAECRAMKRK